MNANSIVYSFKNVCVYQMFFFVGGLFRVGGLLKTYWQGCNFLVDLTAFDVATEFISQASYSNLSNKRTYLLAGTMDNGCVIRTKNHETSKVVGFLGMSVGCPDKIHLC